MEMGLAGSNCVITGASRGIGRAIALGLAAEGANLAICARNEAGLRQAEGELLEHGVKVYAARCDIGKPAALRDFLDASRATLGSVDVLVHNASALALGPDISAWEASLRVDVMAAVNACEQVLPWMKDAGGGSILLVSSISGLEVFPVPDYAYTSAKAALIAFAKKLAVLHGPEGIRVNALAPGSIEFPGGFWDQAQQEDPQMYEMVRASIPCGRLGTPEEVADAAVFLCSPRARWVTGVALAVDGAQHKGIR
jgi:3-oxoacyl-[acyl-carrier protein] reductase